MMVHPGGRPLEYDLEEMGKKLIKWAKLPDSINLCAFCVEYLDEPIQPNNLSRWARMDEGFRSAFNIAKACLGAKRERKLSANELHVKAYDLNAPTYDFFLKEEKRQQAEFESGLKDKKLDDMGDKLSTVLDKLDHVKSEKDFDRKS